MPDTQWLDVILTAGTAAVITASYQAIKNWRESSWKHSNSAVNDLEHWRRDADDAREWEAAQHLWWQERAAELEYIITSKCGPDLLPPKRPYPERPVRDERGRAVQP